MPKLTEETAARLAGIALGHVAREFPHKPDHVFEGPDDVYRARDLHPVFYGSFDWHSCVHGYWMLARLLRRFPAMAPAAAIRALFDAQLTPAKLEAELGYLRRPSSAGFERPYGWAWLLKLATELKRFDAAWPVAIGPLAQAFAERLRAFLPKADYPVRAGTHANSAFALALARDYAVASRDDALLGLLRRKVAGWFGRDRDCAAWEPSGDEFLSPALVGAEAMRRLLPPDEWRTWFDGFLPGLAEGRPETLFRPAVVSDRADGKIAHLDGLNLSRAWCWRSLAEALPAGDPRRASMNAAASDHLAASLPHLADAYTGEHWLATYAVLALDGDD
ncbi:MAG TPA: DUF2891 domain-containing protein [Lichenihabitans sp.]|jgi:hypothetical protein|nr:DUF2891 domain-containing protein [Lichenihabitans sp.]